MKLIKIFLLSWILLFQQALANQVFFLDSRGSAITDYAGTRGRMEALRLAVNMSGIPSGATHRRRLWEIREAIAQNALRLSPRGPTADDIERINTIRDLFNEYRSLAGEDQVQRVLDFAQTNQRTSLMVEGRPEDGAVLTSDQVPSYCQNYPVMERDVLQSFYAGAQTGEDFNCYDISGNGIGLDLSDIGEALVSLEANAYQTQRRELQNGLMMRAIEGILEESSAYSGIYPGTDNNLGNLTRCSYGKGQNLRNLISEHRQGLPERVQRFNQVFGAEENARRNALMATQVRQALIIGNLYNISSRAENRGGSQVATVGGDNGESFAPEIITRCQREMEAQHGFSFSRNNPMDVAELNPCPTLVAENRFEDIYECADALTSFLENRENLTAQRNCYYRESGRGEGVLRDISADRIIPLMSASVDSYPLLFNREDNRSLIPFVSSESNYVPSDFANAVKNLPGAAAISRAVEDVLAQNPENPQEAIDQRLAQPDMLELLSGAISAAQGSEDLNNALKTEITDYQNQLGQSAANVCNSDGEHLHQFPSLVNEVIAKDLEGVTDPQERQRILARRQAAQCWLLEEDPPEDQGGLPGGFFALGVGAIALGLIPGIGWAASAALMAAGTAISATDSYLRFDHARDQFNATQAAFLGGWADSNLVLERAAAYTDATTNLWVEGLSVGILDVAVPIVRTGFQTARRTSDEVFEAINRRTSGESPPIPRSEVLANAALGESERIDLIRRLYPELNESQISGIMRAHNEVPCAVYACSPAELRRKLELMEEAGVPPDIRDAVIRRGIAGSPQTPSVQVPAREGRVGTLEVDGVTYNLNISEERLAHAREHDFPGGPTYIRSLMGDIGDEQISLDFLRSITSSNSNQPIFQRFFRDRNPQGENISFSELMDWVRSTRSPSRQRLNEGLNRIFDDMPNIPFRTGKTTSLFPEDSRLDYLVTEIRNGNIEIRHGLNDSGSFNDSFVFTHNQREFRADFCTQSPGCDCGSGTCSYATGDIQSIYPTCGPGVFQVPHRARFINRLFSNEYTNEEYLRDNLVGEPIVGAIVGNFPDGPLIREVLCR